MTLPLTRADTAMGVHRHPASTAIQRITRDKLAETVSVKDFGAKGDGVTDDAAACQAAYTWAKDHGAAVFWPAGRYRLTQQITIDQSGNVGEDEKRVDTIGAGAGCTVLLPEHSNYCLFLNGPEATTGALHAYQRIEGVRIQGGANCIAIGGKNLPYFAVENCVILNCKEGMYFEDILSSTFTNVIVRGCQKGFTGRIGYTPSDPSDYESGPNNLNFLGCTFSSCSQYGVYLRGGTTLNLFGGSIENNGIGGSGERWGVRLDNPGVNGATGMLAAGVYFENNAGNADIWIIQADAASDPIGLGCSFAVEGCTFNRTSGTNYVTNNIRFDTNATPGALSVIGCGFAAFNDYSPSVDRPCIQLPTAGRGWKAVQKGNFFSAGADAPLWTETPSFTSLLSSDQGISNATTSTVNFMRSEDYGGCFDDSDHSFVAPYNVRMQFNIQLQYTGTMSSGNYATVELRVNGNLAREYTVTVNGAQGLPLSTTLNLLKNDRVQVKTYVNTGGASRTLSSLPAVTYFDGRPA